MRIKQNNISTKILQFFIKFDEFSGNFRETFDDSYLSKFLTNLIAHFLQDCLLNTLRFMVTEFEVQQAFSLELELTNQIAGL